MLGGAKVLVGGTGAGLGGVAAGGGPAATVEIVGDGAGGVEIVDPPGMVEIEPEVEGALIEDGAERHHRAVGFRVTTLQHDLRHPRGASLLNHGLGDGDALPGEAGVRIFGERGGDGAFERPGLGAKCAGQRGQRGDENQEKAERHGAIGTESVT